MKYYIIFDQSPRKNCGACITMATGPEHIHPLWKPMGRGKEEKWLKYVLGGYPACTVLYNEFVKTYFDFPLYRGRWQRHKE